MIKILKDTSADLSTMVCDRCDLPMDREEQIVGRPRGASYLARRLIVRLPSTVPGERKSILVIRVTTVSQRLLRNNSLQRNSHALQSYSADTKWRVASKKSGTTLSSSATHDARSPRSPPADRPAEPLRSLLNSCGYLAQCSSAVAHAARQLPFRFLN
jgi:hypothetical protein